MKTILAAVLLILPLKASAYEGSRFADVWAAASENPYDVLPEEKVTLKSLYEYGMDKLQQSSERTLSDRNDVLPRFQKLLHPNGICLAGTWNITEETAYSGYFKTGSRGLIILRASSALSELKRGQRRAFGIAGKIFPTLDENHQELLPTANFFVIDNLAGTYTGNFLDSSLTNDITFVNPLGLDFTKTGLLAAALKAFGFAEPIFGNVLTVRQLYEISELGETGQRMVITPEFMKIEGAPGPRSEFEDFRDDLRLSANKGIIRLDISIAKSGILGAPKIWKKIGFIELTQDVTADGCDHRLHFHHPNWRKDLVHR